MEAGFLFPAYKDRAGILNTDWTAMRMMGYLSHYQTLRLEEIADEMLAILSDRNRSLEVNFQIYLNDAASCVRKEEIMQKKKTESSNARWNEYLNRGFEG